MSNFIALYALTFFFANWGPNSTTYILPSELFPARFRSSAHGFCAAMGKAGAITGVFGFGILKDTPTSNAGLQVRAPPSPTLIPELRSPFAVFASSWLALFLTPSPSSTTSQRALTRWRGADGAGGADGHQLPRPALHLPDPGAAGQDARGPLRRARGPVGRPLARPQPRPGAARDRSVTEPEGLSALPLHRHLSGPCAGQLSASVLAQAVLHVQRLQLDRRRRTLVSATAPCLSSGLAHQAPLPPAAYSTRPSSRPPLSPLLPSPQR